MKTIHIQPRYHRWHVDPGIEWTEANTRHAQLDWHVPVQQLALVLIDVWNSHYLRETAERSEAIIAQRLTPLVRAGRGAGWPIVHAPSPELARAAPGWIGKDRQPRVKAEEEKAWPPAAFRDKSGSYQSFARPHEPREYELDELQKYRTIHPLLRPEPSDIVIATGDELHAYCREAGILFLFFAGFNTNACVLLRDYGTLAMRQRGYEVIIVRDCTTGMETADTQDRLLQTRGVILFLEMFGSYSVTGGQLVRALTEST